MFCAYCRQSDDENVLRRLSLTDTYDIYIITKCDKPPTLERFHVLLFINFKVAIRQ